MGEALCIAGHTWSVVFTTLIRLPQHADQHGPERPVLLAVDQQLVEGAGLRLVVIANSPYPPGLIITLKTASGASCTVQVQSVSVLERPGTSNTTTPLAMICTKTTTSLVPWI